MRKCLLLVALFVAAVQWNGLSAQVLFNAPDTVCIRQKVQLTPKVAASSYYWGFCSGYLNNNPTQTNLGSGFQFNAPSSIEVAKDGNNYYAFVINRNSNELLRLNYGTSLGNTPTVTNFGNLGNTLPPQPNRISITQDATGKWFLFATGGNASASASLARFDFNTNLGSVPSSVNFGNLGGLMNGPSGLMVAQDGANYYGYIVNSLNNRLLKLDFGTNISLTPTVTNLGNIGGLNAPTDIAAVQESGNWFLLVTNINNNTLSRIAFGNSLNNAPTGTNLGTLGNKLFGPSGITVVKDCGATYAFVTNRLSNEVVRVNIGTIAAGPFTGSALTSPGVYNAPEDISRVIREHDNLYSYVVNSSNNSLSRINFAQCTNSSIPSSTANLPPAYTYDVPGLYNVYLSVNEGLPNASVECQLIRVLPIPYITMHNDTLICQGDTIQLITQSPGALSYTYSPAYGLSDTQGISIFAFPEYSVNYSLHIPYANGCIVDTNLQIDVSKVKADAGADRIVADGANTTLGGPLTTVGPQYFYEWSPQQYLNSPYNFVTNANPSHDITYYLTVTNNLGCRDIDTVVVRVTCNNINLPNAFRPEGKGTSTSHFGLINRQIVQLNYFKVFDRWGREMFSTTDATKGWDGTFNGDPAPFGVYVWEADGFCLSGQHFTTSGNVTLIR